MKKTQDYKIFFAQIRNGTREEKSHFKKKSWKVGEIKPKWIQKLAQNGLKLQSTEIVQRGSDILHATRSKKQNIIADAWWQDLPRHVEEPDAVFLDQTQKEPVLLLIYKGENGLAKKITLQLNKVLKANKKIVNILRTGGLISPQGLEGENYTLLDGRTFWKNGK